MDGVPAGAVQTFVHAVHEFVNTMWWGVIIGIIFLAILSRMPREFVLSILEIKRALPASRATLAGVLLDLCSHGILMVGSKLYERGASAGQIMAFLIASPWNSFSMTVILISLIGAGWTVGFIVLSLVIAIITGLIFDALVARAVLPANPNRRAFARFQILSRGQKAAFRRTLVPCPVCRHGDERGAGIETADAGCCLELYWPRPCAYSSTRMGLKNILAPP